MLRRWFGQETQDCRLPSTTVTTLVASADVRVNVVRGEVAKLIERFQDFDVALTQHTLARFTMRYVHTEDDPVRAAADAVAFRRQGLIDGAVATTATSSAPAPIVVPETLTELTAEADKPLGFEDGNYRSRTKLGNYRPFRHRRGPDRAVPPGTRRNANDAKEAVDAR